MIEGVLIDIAENDRIPQLRIFAKTRSFWLSQNGKLSEMHNAKKQNHTRGGKIVKAN